MNAVVAFAVIALNAHYAVAEDINHKLWTAVGKGDTFAMQTLINEGADVNYADQLTCEPLLVLASKENNLDSARILLENGAIVDARNNGGYTALYFAVYFKRVDMVNLLLYFGADVYANNNSGDTPLMAAHQGRDANVIRTMMLQGNVKPEDDYMLAFLAGAVVSGDEELVKKLIEKGADVNRTLSSQNGVTPLMKAIASDYARIAVILIRKGANINAQDDNGNTALHIATAQGYWCLVDGLPPQSLAQIYERQRKAKGPPNYGYNPPKLDMMKLLIENGADPNIRNKKHQTPLDVAARGYYPEKFTYLLNNGARLYATGYLGKMILRNNVKLDDDTLLADVLDNDHLDNDQMFPPLFRVAELGLVGFAKRLIELGADVNIRTQKQYNEAGQNALDGDVIGNESSPLMFAARYGHYDMVKLLLDNGADFTARNYVVRGDVGMPSNTALTYAAEYGYTDIVRLLISHGAALVPAVQGADWALQLAAGNGHNDIVRLLVDFGAKIDAGIGFGTPLIRATEYNRLDTIVVLLEKGANANTLGGNVSGETALMTAVKRGNKDAALLLLEKGADVNTGNSIGRTALIETMTGSYTKQLQMELLQILLEHGADVNAGTVIGETPLMFSIYSANRLDIMKLLIERSVDVNVRNKYGQTAAILATIDNCETCLRCLIEAGADINITDSHGKSALDYAKESPLYVSNHSTKIVDLLLAAGAKDK